MTRNPHDHREWTNKELEQDPQGYLAAQAAYNENREAERRRGLEEADRQDFERPFVAAGGTKSESDKEWPPRPPGVPTQRPQSRAGAR
jgi:hypothetical protein